MPSSRSARAFGLVALLVAVAVAAAGCGRRDVVVGAGAEPSLIAARVVQGSPAAPPGALSGPTATPQASDAAPVPTPDLSAIDSLVKDIDNDLQADASAGINEGTAP